LTEIRNSECGTVRVDNLEINDRINLDVYIITSYNCLSTDWTYLNFDIDDTETFGADIDLNKTRIDRLVELTKASYKTNRTLLDIPEWIG